MASVDSNNPNDPNNPNNQDQNADQPGPEVNQPSTSAGAGAVTATGAGNVTGQVVGTRNPSQPFQNIASYLSANAPQSAELAGKIAQGVASPIEQTNANITNASTAFGDSVKNAYVPKDDALINQVSTNPVAAAGTPENVEAFKKQLGNTYTGPSDFRETPGFADLSGQVSTAQSRAQNSQSPTGIQTLLREVEGPVTAGINNLDTLLLAQDPANFETISSAGRAANSDNQALQTFLDSETARNNQLAQQGITDAQAGRESATQALTTNQQQLAAKLAQELAKAQGSYTDQNTLNSAVLAAINNANSVSPEQAASIGLDPQGYAQLLSMMGQYASIYGVNPASLGNYLTQPSGTFLPPNLQTAAAPDDYALAQALALLSGNPQSNPLGNGDASLAGSWNAGYKPGSFDLGTARQTAHNKFAQSDADVVNATWAGQYNMPAIGGPPSQKAKDALIRGYLAGTIPNYGGWSQTDPFGNPKMIGGGHLPGDPPPHLNPAYVSYGSNPAVYG